MKPTQEMIEAEAETAKSLMKGVFRWQHLATALATARMEGHNAAVEKAFNLIEPSSKENKDLIMAIYGLKIGGDA